MLKLPRVEAPPHAIAVVVFIAVVTGVANWAGGSSVFVIAVVGGSFLLGGFAMAALMKPDFVPPEAPSV